LPGALLTGEQAPADLVTVDVPLGDRSGRGLVAKVRGRSALPPGSSPSRSTLPIVLIVPAGHDELARRGLHAGADEVLEKPLKPHVLLPCVRQLLRMKAMRDELEAQGHELSQARQAQRAFVD